MPINELHSKSTKIAKCWGFRPQNPAPPASGYFAYKPPFKLNNYRLENVQDPTPIESTGRCICWANFGAKRNLYFIFSAPLFKKHSRATGLKINDRTVKIEEFTGYDS